MILALTPRVRSRLDQIEKLEGIPPLEVVHQAVEVWCSLTVTERQAVGLAAIQLVAMRRRQNQGDHS